MRTYDKPIYMFKSGNERMDQLALATDEILDDSLSVKDRLTTLASIDMVVGVPNEWIWAATAWEKPLVVLYPDELSTRRWLPWTYDHCGRIAYELRQLYVSLLLAGIRKLVNGW